MAILLKDQLNRRHFLKEISYSGPVFDDEYYSKISRNEIIPRKGGVQLFYDLYAIYSLWREYGFGLMSKEYRQKVRSKDATGEEWTSTEPFGSIFTPSIHPDSQRIITNCALYAIDEFFSSAVYTTGKNLETYLRHALRQEFRYIAQGKCPSLQNFAGEIISIHESNELQYFKGGNVVEERPFIDIQEFEKVLNKHCYGFSAEEIYKLLNFWKLENGEYTVTKAIHIIDLLLKELKKKNQDREEDGEEEAPDLPDLDAGIHNPSSKYFQKDTDLDPEYQEFDKKSKVAQKKIELSTKLRDLLRAGKISKSTYKKYMDQLSKTRLTEGNISLSIVNRVENNLEQSGIGWKLIEDAFNKLRWSSNYGGIAWGVATAAYLRLKKSIDSGEIVTTPEETMEIIDYIYSLEHNTGALLDKGPMFVTRVHLDRRFRMQHWVNFIPYVSLKVKKLLSFYSRINPQARKEYAIYQLRNTPAEEFTPLEVDQLIELGFQEVPEKSTDVTNPEYTYKEPRNVKNRFRIQVNYKTDKKPLEEPVYLEISKHRKKYIISLELEHKFIYFNTFEKAIDYLSNRTDLIRANKKLHNVDEAQKNKFINSYTVIKLSREKEAILLDECNMGWKDQMYEAYFKGYVRFRMYAFSNGLYMCTFNNSPTFNVLYSWEETLNYCKKQTIHAKPHPNPEKIKSQMTLPMTDRPYALEEEQKASIQNLIAQTFVQTSQFQYRFVQNQAGEYTVFRKTDVNVKPMFSIKKLNVEGKDDYTIFHWLSTNSKESYSFNTWDDAFNFLSRNIHKLSLAKSLSDQTSQTAQISSPMDSIFNETLPPNATSQALYTAHVGIDGGVKKSIRLTEEDESKLVSVGFVPKMVGNEVWYIHKYNSDTIKFYADDSAFIIKTTYSVGKSKMKILEAINWALTHYAKNSGATSPDSLRHTTIDGSQNVKMGSMFEKHITNAGFRWDESSKSYIDGNNKIIINPFPKSTLYIGDKIMTFNGLLDLIEFVKNEYPTLKK